MKVYDSALLAEGACHLQVRRRQGQGVRGEEVHHPGFLPGLHRVRRLRQRLPGLQEGERREDRQEGHQHGPPAPPEGPGGEELRVLPRPARGGSEAHQAQHHQGLPVHPAAVRVLRRLRRVRRDPVREAHEPALRRPRDHRATPRDAPRSTAGTSPPRPTRRARTGAGRPGPTRCSRTRRSSGSGCGSPRTRCSSLPTS